jgi:hypothetical protein
MRSSAEKSRRRPVIARRLCLSGDALARDPLSPIFM